MPSQGWSISDPNMPKVFTVSPFLIHAQSTNPTTIQITGLDFDSTATVTIGNSTTGIITCSNQKVVNSTTITCDMPTIASASTKILYPVIVSNNNGAAISNQTTTLQYIYYPFFTACSEYGHQSFFGVTGLYLTSGVLNVISNGRDVTADYINHCQINDVEIDCKDTGLPHKTATVQLLLPSDNSVVLASINCSLP